MYVVIEDIEYEGIAMLGASESYSMAEKFLEKIVEEKRREKYINHYIFEELRKWDQDHPIPDAPTKPYFDQNCANDKEYVKKRNENEVKAYHEAKNVYHQEVLLPYTEKRDSHREYLRNYVVKAKIPDDFTFTHFYKIEHIKTI